MEEKKYYFRGLSWMKPEEIQKLRENLLTIQHQTRGIEFEIVLREDVMLVISGFIELLKNQECEERITFLFKYTNYAQGKYLEDELLMLTINSGTELNLYAQRLFYDGTTDEILLK